MSDFLSFLKTIFLTSTTTTTKCSILTVLYCYGVARLLVFGIKTVVIEIYPWRKYSESNHKSMPLFLNLVDEIPDLLC